MPCFYVGEDTPIEELEQDKIPREGELFLL